jgi:hypothetical protein
MTRRSWGAGSRVALPPAYGAGTWRRWSGRGGPLQQFRLGPAIVVEKLHQQQLLPRVQVHGAQHGGGMAAVGAGELEDGVAQRPPSRRARKLR